MREKAAYRANIERLKEVFPDKDILTKSDVVKFSGKTYKTVNKMIDWKKKNYISVATLASLLS